MAKMNLSKNQNNGFTLIPEGETTFKIMSVDDSQFEDFGKLKIRMQTASGDIHLETFSLKRSNGEINDKALNAWSYFARTCIGNFGLDEIDTDDIVGHYMTATVKHVTYTKTRGEHAGDQATAVQLTNYKPANGFPSAKKEESQKQTVSLEDIDNFLNE